MLREVTSGKPPRRWSRFKPDGEPGQGPAGIRQRLEAKAGRPVDLALWAADDGIRTFYPVAPSANARTGLEQVQGAGGGARFSEIGAEAIDEGDRAH